ncbi:hypothetical protein SAMN04487948_101328 [Halogranum amylolyticum]|uniref:Uncharacterized protein n=1 Tax=Halogranum amylolyticum TaxID=660520 RepID=A0A1H8N5I7_9EURY|nr:helix-turn-helix domain-containing protein [Halogranum amylolyticum]SEO24877.1 hypothetical protein SAMN04487948_101328 [Halogranum amylolyticum]
MTVDTTAPPEEVFALLGNEIRMQILQALFEDPYTPLSFSTLRERVGERDSGKFNYHLGKLVGRFVRKTDDGYELTLAGWQIVGAMLAGTYTSSGTIDPIDLDVVCPECAGTVRLTYEDERLTVACVDCEEQLSSAGVPPGVVEGYDREEIPHVFEQWMRALVEQAERGFCISCSGRIVPEVLVDCEDEHLGRVDEPRVKYTCQRCPEVVSLALGSALLNHPAVVGFHYDHDVDLRTVQTWSLDWARRGAAVTESRDPLRARVDITLGEDTLSLVVDDTFSVVEVRDSRTA